MKAKEIRDLTTPEIKEQIKSSKRELFNLRFQLATSQLGETACIRTIREAVARLKAIARGREIERSKANQ